MSKRLTPKQEAFAVACAAIDAGKPSDAYRQIYDCKSMSSETIRVEAARLLANPTIALRIQGLRDARAERAGLQDETVLAELAKVVYADAGAVTTRDRLTSIDMAMKHLGLFAKDNAQQAESLVLRVETAQPVKR